MKTGTEPLAPVSETTAASPGKNPGADTDTVMVSSGRPWVKFKDSAERDRLRPAVLLNWKLETCHIEDCCTPRARAWTWNSGVVPLPMTGVRGVTSSRIAASDGERAAKLRLEAPRKSSAQTRARNRVASNPSSSYVE